MVVKYYLKINIKHTLVGTHVSWQRLAPTLVPPLMLMMDSFGKIKNITKIETLK
jgi:hypothetical protein